MKNKYFILLIFVLCCNFTSFSQYATKHYIAPSPWQYWSKANEIVISTLSTTTITVELYKSDGTRIPTRTPLTVVNGTPLVYRFFGNPATALRNEIDTNYTDRGLIVVADAPILINLRNVASDFNQDMNSSTIKGNASLVSFGNEGMGMEFRLGYYRTDFTGLNLDAPIFSVMAINDDTEIKLDGNVLTTLNKGESRLFKSRVGGLLEANKVVVVNVGSYGDMPQACDGQGEDGTVDQVAPNNALGLKYLVLRGGGVAGTTSTHPEQSTFVASQENTTVIVENFTPEGILINQQTYTLAQAGDFKSIHHGDAQNKFSSSLITSNKPIIVYSGSAVDCETDISTVLPIGGCAGTKNIQTTKFTGYVYNNLIYFGYIIVESATEAVFINGQNIETTTNNTRKAIGDSGFYFITFTNIEISNPTNLIITSNARMTTSIVQQGTGYSMSGFFSSFGNSPDPPVKNFQDNCLVVLSTNEGLEPYQWYFNGEPILNAHENTITVHESGNYSVKGIRDCGETTVSAAIYVDEIFEKCSDLKISKNIESINDAEVVFSIKVENLSDLYNDTNVVVKEFFPSGYSFVNASTTLGFYDEVNMEWHIGNLEKESNETLMLKAKILPTGDHLNKVTVQGDNFDPNIDNNTATSEVELEALYLSKLAIEKEYHNIGDQIEYEIKVKNIGTKTLNNITIIDDNADIGTLIPNKINLLEPDQQVSVTAKHTISLEEYIIGKVINQARATAVVHSGELMAISDNPSTPQKDDPTITLLNRSADIETTKTNNNDYYVVGTDTEYIIIVKNNGPTAAINVNIEDQIPEGISEMYWKNSKGEQGDGDINTYIDVLNVGESITFNTVIKIPLSKKGNLINKVVVSSDIDDPNPICLECVDIDYEIPVFPKGISPNEDGFNDFLDLENYIIPEIVIYNRYGSEVFRKKNYKKEWFGQSNINKPLPSGTYFYTVSLVGGEIVTGWIQLMY